MTVAAQMARRCVETNRVAFWMPFAIVASMLVIEDREAWLDAHINGAANFAVAKPPVSKGLACF